MRPRPDAAENVKRAVEAAGGYYWASMRPRPDAAENALARLASARSAALPLQ